MKHYQCCIHLNEDWTADKKGEISHQEMVETAFKGTGITFDGLLGLPFHDFLATNEFWAQLYITDKLPFFKDLEWTRDVMDDYDVVRCVKYQCQRRALKLRLYEYDADNIPDASKIKFFDSMISTIDILFEGWYEDDGIAGEHTIRHTELKQTTGND